MFGMDHAPSRHFSHYMKAILILATLTLASLASASDTAKTPPTTSIAPAPEMNLYAATAPEPSHATLLMLGLLGLTVRRRR
jgi:hypothetical protein